MTAILVGIVYVVPAISLKIPLIKRNVTHIAENELSKFLGTTVTIGKADISWFNKLTIKNVTVLGMKNDTIFHAENLITKLKITPLLKGKLVLTTIRLIGFECHITKDSPETDMNVQFILDKLSDGDSGGDNLEVRVKSILVGQGKIFYDVLDKPRLPNNLFDPNHIQVNDLNGKFMLNVYGQDGLDLQVKKFGLNEKSGFRVDKLTAHVMGRKDSVSVNNLIIRLPNSRIDVAHVGVGFRPNDGKNEIYDQPIVVNLKESRISPADFAAFAPYLEKFSDVLSVSFNVAGTINSPIISRISLNYNNHLSFLCNLSMKDMLKKGQELYLSGQIKNLSVTPDGIEKIGNIFAQSEFSLPEAIFRLKRINFMGEVSGFVNRLLAKGDLNTHIGSVQMDMLIANTPEKDTTMLFNGNLSSSDLNLSGLFPEENPYGIAHFDAAVNIAQKDNKYGGLVDVHLADFEYRDYIYNNVILSGYVNDRSYNGIIDINDKNGKIRLQGTFDNTTQPVVNVTAKVRGVHLDKLHLLDKYEAPEVSFDMQADFRGDNVDDFKGAISFRDVSFHTSKDSFNLNFAKVETFSNSFSEKEISITSDLVNGHIKGRYSFRSLLPDLYATIGQYLPSLTSSIDNKNTSTKCNDFGFDLNIGNTERMSSTLTIPITFHQNTHVRGKYDSQKDEIDIEADMPLFSIKKTLFENGHIHTRNTSDLMKVEISARHFNQRDVRNDISILLDASDDRINTTLHWQSDKAEKFQADISASALFTVDEDNGSKKLRTEITIPESNLILKDSTWTIEPSSITVTGRKVDVDNFFVTKRNQYLRIDGSVSEGSRESLRLDLNGIELGYIFDIIDNKALQFAGKATGYIIARELLTNVMLDSRLEIEDFSFNNAIQGKLNLSSEWDKDEQGILLLGSIYKNDSTWTDVNGYIYPIGEKQGLSLYFDANDINIAFVQYYFNAFASDVQGSGYGNVHLFGNFSNIAIEGTPYIKDGNIKLNILNTTYTFSDSVFLDKTSIRLKNTNIFDQDKNVGKLNLLCTHDYFHDIHYDIDIEANKTMVYNITERMNPQLYGKVYASGTAKVKGTEDFITIDGNIRSNAGTNIGFNFMGSSTAEDYDFISFKGKKTEGIDSLSTVAMQENKSSSIDYQLDFHVDVTPEANIEFVMDEATNDRIKGNGNGNLQIQYGKKSDLQMFGNYIINDGSYNFSLQQVIQKLFKLRNGSSVAFHGDPMKANVNIDAAYYLTANIQDLDESLIMESAYMSVPVNCILNISGQLQNPTVGFDIEFPNSSSELERKVKAFIDTEDMMTRQIVYLLVLNKFYTPDYARGDYHSNEFSAIASNALSAQLSNILNSLTDKVQIGTNIRSRQDGLRDTEVEMLLSSQLLNNRLIFNGNFGYKDNYIQSNAFVGEFDLEYKLIRSGEIRLKAYNHANDLYRYNTKSLTRQGVGIMFQKDFTTLMEILRRKRRKKQIETETPDKTLPESSNPEAGQ